MLPRLQSGTAGSARTSAHADCNQLLSFLTASAPLLPPSSPPRPPSHGVGKAAQHPQGRQHLTTPSLPGWGHLGQGTSWQCRAGRACRKHSYPAHHCGAGRVLRIWFVWVPRVELGRGSLGSPREIGLHCSCLGSREMQARRPEPLGLETHPDFVKLDFP